MIVLPFILLAGLLGYFVPSAIAPHNFPADMAIAILIGVVCGVVGASVKAILDD